MAEFFEKRPRFEENPLHRELAWKLFLKRWEKLEPKEYEVWKSNFVDTNQDAFTTNLIAEAYYTNLQEQHRFPDDKSLFTIVDDILQQPTTKGKNQKIKAFLESPDPNPRTNRRRVGRFATDDPDSISA